MSTIEQDLNLLRKTKSSIKSAIEEKGQTVGSIPFSEYPEKIKAIETGTDLPELSNPGTADDLLLGKQLIDQEGNALTGTIPTKKSTDLKVYGAYIDVPAGYYAETATGKVSEVRAANIYIDVNKQTGLVTASGTQDAGYVPRSSLSKTYQLTTQSAQTITPSTMQKTAVAANMYTLGAVTVAGSPYLLPENIKKGISIFDVEGTYETSPVIISPDSPKTAQITSYAVLGYNALNFSLDGGPYTVNDMSVFAAKLTISGSLAEASSSYMSLSNRAIYIYVMKDAEGIVAMRYNSLYIVTIKSSDISLSGSTLTIKLRSDTSGGYPYFYRIDSAQATEAIAVYT